LPRNPDDVRERLQQAALELYRERGYERTTTAEIASRAGVTERTFFRHFPDKREVLFDGEQTLHEALSAGIAAAPDSLGPMEILLATFRSLEPMIEANRRFSEPRQAVIAATPALQERADAKAASMTSTLAAGLRRRGVEARLAALAAGAGMAVFQHAARCWFEDPSVSLATHLERASRSLRELSSAGSQERPLTPR
jgi:AcrR family transcriptional regulator